jgi:hypothetical protein
MEIATMTVALPLLLTPKSPLAPETVKASRDKTHHKATVFHQFDYGRYSDQCYPNAGLPRPTR